MRITRLKFQDGTVVSLPYDLLDRVSFNDIITLNDTQYIVMQIYGDAEVVDIAVVDYKRYQERMGNRSGGLFGGGQ